MSEKPVILIADDNKINRVVVRATFRGSDYTVLEAADGSEAVELAREYLPDIILMDLMMPEMDGLEATRRLKGAAETNRIPILMLTALNDTEDRINAFDAGVTGFLTKPFDRLELLAHVRSYINLSLINKRYILSTANRHTGLPNQSAYAEQIGEYTNPVLFLVHVDDIDKINTFYGEEKSSQFEQQFAEYLSARCPPLLKDAEFFHFHRGSFGLLLESGGVGISRKRLIEAGEALHGALSVYDESSGGVEQVSDYTVVISTGSERIYDDAFVALREAQREKISCMYAPDVSAAAYSDIQQNMESLQMIRRAVSAGKVEPFFQPILDNRTGKIAKYEALVRLIDEEGNTVSPGAFMLVAKNSRYYDIITRIMLDRAFEVFESRNEALSVNLSVVDIENETTREHILELLLRYPGVARRLTIELVEEESIRHYDRVKAFINSVAEHGVTVAIDDFGSGYSNFQRILELEVDFIKIDGSIVRYIADEPVYRNLASVICQFAQFSGIPIIAEFVENQAIQDTLIELGVEYSQGYHIGRPQRLETIEVS